MGVQPYEVTADGSDFDQLWTEGIAKALGRITNVGLYPVVTASYIIFKVSTTYYVKNGSTGVITDSNADAATLRNSVKDLLVIAGGGTIYWKGGAGVTYEIASSIELASNVNDIAEKGTVLKATADNIYMMNGDNVTNVSIEGITFDMDTRSWQAILMSGSDASGALSDINVEGCRFINPIDTRSLHFEYTIVNPAIPTNQNERITVKDCYFEGASRTGSAVVLLFVNCHDFSADNVFFEGCTSDALGIWGYNRHGRIKAFFKDGEEKDVQLVQSEEIELSIYSNNIDEDNIQINNCQNITIHDSTLECPAIDSNIRIVDGAGATFDTHTNLVNGSNNIKVHSNTLTGGFAGVVLRCSNRQDQDTIIVEDNLFLGGSYGVLVSQVQAVADYVQELHILKNVMKPTVAAGSRGVLIIGNAGATNGGIQGIVIRENVMETGGTYSIEVQNLADDLTIMDNTLEDPIEVVAAVTNQKYHAKPFQFIKELNGDYLTASPTGIEIDANTEGAILQGRLPLLLQQVIRLRIDAVALAAPVNAGGQMHLEMTFNAGIGNAAYNTAAKSWTLANHDSEEADYVNGDVVSWLIEDGDVGNELGALIALDKFEMLVTHEASSDPDGETDAVFGSLIVEYV